MLWALTKPVPDERTDLGAIFPEMVVSTFIFDIAIVDSANDEVRVSLAWIGAVEKERALAAAMATSALLIEIS